VRSEPARVAKLAEAYRLCLKQVENAGKERNQANRLLDELTERSEYKDAVSRLDEANIALENVCKELNEAEQELLEAAKES
jgi:hypothetical protein